MYYMTGLPLCLQVTVAGTIRYSGFVPVDRASSADHHGREGEQLKYSRLISLSNM
jgi:hypothetical protein